MDTIRATLDDYLAARRKQQRHTQTNKPPGMQTRIGFSLRCGGPRPSPNEGDANQKDDGFSSFCKTPVLQALWLEPFTFAIHA